MTAHKPGDPTTLNRLYGRSSGHKLRKGQQDLLDALLPEIVVPEDGEIDSRRLFGDDRPLHFEIGFGGTCDDYALSQPGMIELIRKEARRLKLPLG